MHILLFLLLFLAAIVIFGLSIVGFVLSHFRAWPWFVFPDEAGKEWTKWPAARPSQL